MLEYCDFIIQYLIWCLMYYINLFTNVFVIDFVM